MKKLMIILSLFSISAFANCSVDAAKADAANLIEEEFVGGPVASMQRPSIVVESENEFSYHLILAAKITMRTGKKQLLLARMSVDKASCVADYQFVGMTEGS